MSALDHIAYVLCLIGAGFGFLTGVVALRGLFALALGCLIVALAFVTIAMPLAMLG